MSESKTIEKRKEDHIKLCVNEDVSFKVKTTLLEEIELNYKTLPEISLDDVDLSTKFLNKDFSFPFIVSAMTGGAQVAKNINLEVAEACQDLKVGMGLGSMRAMIVNSDFTETYDVKSQFPDVFLAGNLGAVQLHDFSTEKITEAIEPLKLDALAIHLNLAQEAVQPEGDHNFSGLIEKIDDLSKKLKTPIYVKEVGHGISYDIAKQLSKTNIKAIDVQGAGGTSWTAVDALRHPEGVGLVFREIGIPTAVSIMETKKALENTDKKIIASGGIYNGLDAAKAIMLGADFVGNAIPVLKAQQKGSVEGIKKYLSQFKREMEISSFLVGAKSIEELQKEKPIILSELKGWLSK